MAGGCEPTQAEAQDPANVTVALLSVSREAGAVTAKAAPTEIMKISDPHSTSELTGKPPQSLWPVRGLTLQLSTGSTLHSAGPSV